MRKVELLGTGLFTALLFFPLVWKSVGPLPEAAETIQRPHVARDLSAIRRDTLRVLVLQDPLTWEPRPGAMTGLEWEILARFGKHRHIPVKAIPVANRDTMLAMLQNGHGDIIAAQLAANGWSSPYTLHTHPYRMVAPTKAILRHEGTKTSVYSPGDTMAVSAWSPFIDSTGQLIFGNGSAPFRIAEQLPEQLMIRTALSREEAVLVTDATASMEAKRLPLLVFGSRQGTSVPLVFAVRTNSVHLQQALDTWQASEQGSSARDALIDAYDKGLDTRGPQRSFRALTYGADTISPFDSLFQLHADSLAWDWKLLAAVAYKESQFDTAAISRAGAEGLMQMMPNTAALMGLDSSSGTEAHIQAASRYLARLDRIWQAEIPAPAQRLKFVLAAYNSGPGHIKDAQRLAKELGLDPLRWDNNVERALVLLNRPLYFTLACAKTGYCRGQDTFWYVRDVLNLFAWLRGRQPGQGT